MNNKSKKDMQKQSFTQIFSYQLDEVNKDARYNSYLVPLHWFVKLYTRRTHKMTMGILLSKWVLTQPHFQKCYVMVLPKTNVRSHLNILIAFVR